MKWIVYANLPHALTTSPFVEYLYQNDECLIDFEKELQELFINTLDNHLKIQSYIRDRVNEVEESSISLDKEEVESFFRELVEAVKELAESCSVPECRLVALQLRLPNIIRIEVAECQDLLSGLNMTATS